MSANIRVSQENQSTKGDCSVDKLARRVKRRVRGCKRQGIAVNKIQRKPLWLMAAIS